MRILVYDWSLFRFGGGQKFNCKIIEHFSKKHSVDILTLFQINVSEIEKAYNVDFSRINKIIYLFKKNRININPTFLHLLSFKKVSKISKNYDLFFNAEAHESVKPRAKYNMIYCHFFEQKKYRPAKNLIDFFKLVFVYIFKSMLKNHAKKYNIYCNSNYTKYWLKKDWKVDAKVLYPPIDIPKKKKKNKKIEKKNIILSTGRLSPDKNYEFVIHCFKKIYSTNKNYECIICGIKSDEQYYNKLMRLSKEYPIKIIMGVSGKELKNLYDKAKIFIQAKGLHVNDKRYPALLEHFGMAAVEAMAHGCVPVLLNKAGYKETIEHEKNGFLFNSKEEAIEKLKLLIKNEKLRKKMSKAAKKRAKKFSLERMHREIDDAVKETIQEQS